MGPHTIRTLLIGLHDENREVRKIVEKEIVTKLPVGDVLSIFGDKSSQKLSLKIAIRDILEKSENLHANTRAYFNEIILNLDHELYHSQNEANDNEEFENEGYSENYNNNSNYRERDINY